MSDMATMYVIQGRVFAPDVVPYRLIITPFGTNHLKQALGFRDATWNQDNGDYVFQDGALEYDGVVVPVMWLGFNERRIVVQVQGDSAAAHNAYSSVSVALTELVPGFQGAEPIVLNEETSYAARLNFEWSSLLNPVIVDQLSVLAKHLSTGNVRRVVKGVSLRFTLGAVSADEKLSEYGIALQDQTVVIEPRADVPLAEQVYFTYSPCDSDAHLKMVSGLDDNLTKTKIGAKKRARVRVP
ncbi:MAG TPA: hypothetical protein VIE43_04260 [Thermoanaerobaculia bacterium]|jgi:hypothetical protein|nr:hypothetical protein [Thermoanaerobaculia bacterium]